VKIYFIYLLLVAEFARKGAYISARDALSNGTSLATCQYCSSSALNGVYISISCVGRGKMRKSDGSNEDMFFVINAEKLVSFCFCNFIGCPFVLLYVILNRVYLFPTEQKHIDLRKKESVVTLIFKGCL
jgi:hypothetical protein